VAAAGRRAGEGDVEDLLRQAAVEVGALELRSSFCHGGLDALA
jgi:hypothetical protein